VGSTGVTEDQDSAYAPVKVPAICRGSSLTE
jgi:hypothetical protein